MRSIAMFFVLVVMSALLAGPLPALDQKAPNDNQCTMIPEVMEGDRAYESTAAPYEPEVCVAALDSENTGSELAGNADRF